MDDETLKLIAQQLRKPQGEYAIHTGEKMNEGNLYINLFTIEALKLEAADNVLEIGMGNGFFVKNILSVHDSVKYAGCDFSEIMVGEACKYNERFIETGQAKFFLASADKLPFGDEAFDKIFSINTIYFWDDPALVLSEIWRVLKPKGQIIISIRPQSVMEHYAFAKFGFNMFSKEDLANLLSKSNFKVMTILEKEEPEQEITGTKMKVETLLICAQK